MARAILLGYAEDKRKRATLRIRKRQLRARSAPMELPEEEFVANFRISKSLFKELVDELRPHMPSTRRTTAVRNELKVLAALSFFAQRSYQKSVCASYLYSMSQPTFSKCLNEVTSALNAPEILKKYIKFPMNQQSREAIMRKFMEKFGFPGVIGCIDGSHVALIRPVEHEESYFNRKNYHSLNVLLICDSELNILHVDSSYGGASHDSFVWNQSPVKSYLERLESIGEHCWLLGDSGYAQRPWMMTPILGAASGSPEEFYTNQHCRVRNTVERCIGVLKSRWRCLLAHRVLHYDPVKAAKIVNACAVLHNVSNMSNTPAPELPEADFNNDQQRQVSTYAARIERISDSSRDTLVDRLWNARN